MRVLRHIRRSSCITGGGAGARDSATDGSCEAAGAGSPAAGFAAESMLTVSSITRDAVESSGREEDGGQLTRHRVMVPLAALWGRVQNQGQIAALSERGGIAMPIYEYECDRCHRRSSVLTLRVSEKVKPV